MLSNHNFEKESKFGIRAMCREFKNAKNEKFGNRNQLRSSFGAFIQLRTPSDVQSEFEWHHDSAGSKTLWRHIAAIPNINRCMFHISGTFKFFPFNIKSYRLPSISCLRGVGPKIWHAVESLAQKDFKQSVVTEVLSNEYLNDHLGDAR